MKYPSVQLTRSLARYKTSGTPLRHLTQKKVLVDEIIRIAKESDGIFPILHGVGGEDGVLQAAFEEANIPYFGPSALSCHNTFDKVIFKKLLESQGLPTPAWNTVTVETLEGEPLTQHPFVLKPIDGGSSIDTLYCA